MYTGLISYCTPIKGRLEHLKQTLPYNLKFTDEATQFVIVNYGDSEGLDDWVKSSGINRYPKVKYVLYDHTGTYHHAHAKNVAHKAADGDF